LTGIEAVENCRQQSGGQRDAHTERVQRASRIALFRVLEQEKQAAEKADNDANQQDDDNDFQQDFCLFSGSYFERG
jgi:hypothetical protein